MRKPIAAILVLGLAVMGAPLGLMAQVPGVQQGVISGEAVDAGGRPLPNIRVQLLEAAGGGQSLRVVLQATLTGSQGEWTFTNVEPGEYVVQIVVNDHVAGIPVSVGAGAMVGGVLIVAPSAVALSAFPGGEVGAALVTVAVAGGILGTVIYFNDGS